MSNEMTAEKDSITLSDLLLEYKEYTKLFFSQVFDHMTFNQHASNASYMEYLDLCSQRVYSFSTWYEHTTNETFPDRWKDLADLKFQRDQE